MKSLHSIFIKELSQIYDAEEQIMRALPKMVQTAADEDLKDAFQKHLEQTGNHIDRLKEASANLNESFNVNGGNVVVKSLIMDADKIIKGNDESPVKDAALIAGAQKIEHYEIASYGSAIAWARAMGHDNVADLLHDTLDEEVDTDKNLSKLAEGGMLQSGINDKAVSDDNL